MFSLLSTSVSGASMTVILYMTEAIFLPMQMRWPPPKGIRHNGGRCAFFSGVCLHEGGVRGGFINIPGTQTLQQTLVRLKAGPKYSRSELNTASEISTLQILLCDDCFKLHRCLPLLLPSFTECWLEASTCGTHAVYTTVL